jgi:hypothetical protein
MPQQSLELTSETVLPAIATLPLLSGQNYPIYSSMFDVWQAAYPAVDVKAELKKIHAWLMSNPTKRKTKSGMAKFINFWLAKEQNNPQRNGNGHVGNRFVEAEREQLHRVARAGRS